VTGESVPPEQVNEVPNDGVGGEFGDLNPFQQLGYAQVESEIEPDIFVSHPLVNNCLNKRKLSKMVSTL
jgi:hypothetical protein